MDLQLSSDSTLVSGANQILKDLLQCHLQLKECDALLLTELVSAEPGQ